MMPMAPSVAAPPRTILPVEELPGIGQVLPHHGLLLRGHGGDEIRAFRAEGGEEGEAHWHTAPLLSVF